MILGNIVVLGGAAYSPNWMGIHVLGVGLSVVTIRKFKIFLGWKYLGPLLTVHWILIKLAVGYTYLW